MELVWKKLYLAVILLSIAGGNTYAQSFDESKVDPYVLQAISEAPDAYHSVILELGDAVDIMALEQELAQRRATLEERAYEVITRLQAKAEATQPPLLEKLEGLDGIRAGSIHPFWITNIIIVEAKGEAIARLSREKAIGQIFPNPGVVLVDECVMREEAPALENNAEPGLSAIGARQMWDMGYTGYGRKAMIIDTGQEPSHPALHNQFLYHNRDFGEAWRGSTDPEDCDSHGSHVTGTVLGLDRIEEDTIGVAFDANWMGGIGLGGGCSAGADIAGTIGMFQWAINPDGNPSTIDDMPDVINNSWRNLFPSAGNCGNHPTLSTINALMTAGVAVIFASGNEGPTTSSIGDPPINNISLVRVFSVGNVNGNNPNFPINPSSSRGPTVCGGEGSLLIKPEVSAPGTNVRSSVTNGGYANFSGTSMAAPHTAGAVLLLKEAFPYLTGEDILLALYFSAIDLGAPGEDNSYGMGIINLPAAFQYLIDEGNEPVPPADRANDVILLQVDTRELNCEEQIAPRLLVENNGGGTITSMEIQHFLQGEGSPAVFTYEWEGQLEPGERKYIQMPAMPSETGDFEYVANIAAVNGQADARRLNNQLKTKVRILADEFIDGQVSGNRDVCQGGQALLQSLYDGPAAVRWYDEPEGGNLLAEGDDALLPVGDEPFTVFMEVSPREKVGRLENQEGTIQFSTDADGLSFDAYTAFTIKSVKVYTEEAGSRLLVLEGPSGYAITKVVPMGVGEQRVELDLEIEPGEGWELRLKAGKPLGLNLGGANYPYTIPNVLSINRSTQSLIFYHYFYDWEVEFPYFCGRTPVAVEVAETDGAPQVAFSPVDAEIDLSSGFNEVSFTEQTEGGTFWLWNFGDGSTSTMRNPVHAYADTGFYQVTLTVIGQNGCATTTSGTVTVTETDLSSVSPLAQEYGMEVFPNPASSRLYLTLSIPQPQRADVYLADMLGRPVWHQRRQLSADEAVEIPVSALPAGLYSVIVRLDGRQVARRVAISR